MQRKGQDFAPNLKNRAYQMAKGKFIDLTCTGQGERVLENLFSDEQAEEQYWEDERIILGAITALQSLCIMATQVGVKGTPEQLKRMVAHLETPEGDPLDVNVWDSVKRLKYQVDQTAGTQYLSLVNKKRNPKGAFDVLVSLGAWDKHENLPLLRSGFPIRFTPKEEEAAITASMNTRDPDAILGLRQDFRREKVYTIDSASTVEIDDGLSLEVISNEDGSTRQRFWYACSQRDHDDVIKLLQY
jgi:exoribonuclease R